MATLFPSQSKQDAKYFATSQEDVAIIGSMEGGYDTARPRTTRKPRKMWVTGFTEITNAQKIALDAFYDTVGKYGLVTWTHPVSGVVYTVRITEWPEAKYAGHGPYVAWDYAPIKLKEV